MIDALARLHEARDGGFPRGRVFLLAIALCAICTSSCSSPAAKHDVRGDAAGDLPRDGGAQHDTADTGRARDGRPRPDAPPPTPVCSLDGKPLGKVVKDFVGIITFELYSALGTVESIAQRLADAGVTHVRIMVQWSTVQPNGASDGYDFAGRDAVIEPFTSRGIKPLLTLGYPAAWAAQSATANAPKASALAAWDAYVHATLQHYKALGVRDWQVWNEPDFSFRTTGVSDAHTEYVKLLNRTTAIIRQEDPNAAIWGPDTVVGHAPACAPPAPCRPTAEQFTIEALKQGDFDIFTFHSFPSATPGLPAAIKVMLTDVAAYKALAQQHRPGVPIAVTAAQVLAPTAYPATCPYVGNTEQEQARTLEDIYVCLANAGVRNVFWYKTIDRGLIDRCDGGKACPGPASCDTASGFCMVNGQPYPHCYDAAQNPKGTELSGVLGPHPLGKAAEYDGDCISKIDCSKLEHTPKAAYWALRAIGRWVGLQP